LARSARAGFRKRRESDVEKRKLGTRALEVSTIGLGMSEFYGRANQGEATAPIHRVLDLGENFRSGR
jgi:aryl-alcohol dehydrogenase-like predicted oxidoreductase